MQLSHIRYHPQVASSQRQHQRGTNGPGGWKSTSLDDRQQLTLDVVLLEKTDLKGHEGSYDNEDDEDGEYGRHYTQGWTLELEGETGAWENNVTATIAVRVVSKFDSTSTMAKLVSTLCVWQSKLLLHLCNQEIDDMKGIYKKVFLSIRHALCVHWHCTTVACQRPAISTSTLITSHH